MEMIKEDIEYLTNTFEIRCRLYVLKLKKAI